MKLVGAVLLIVFTSQGEGWRRRRARRPACHAHDCVLSEWSMWSHCSHVCGINEVQRRVRWKIEVESCGGTCHHTLSETRSCNRHCFNGGTPLMGHCKCQDGFTGRCCEYDDDFQQQLTEPTDKSGQYELLFMIECSH
ncbi:hypothetical protein AC249_AIPGENE20230 [Exaiptasia diaphana]|nr:hypothetical protein AC249_AIPGENE20230 [Exaiptasia diaphana]